MERYEFNAALARDEAVAWLKKEGERANFNKVVIGISGGKDSTIAAALCCRAFGRENVHGLLLPNGMQKDIDDSIKVCDILGIKYDTINIKPIYEAFILQYNLCTMGQEFKCSNASDISKLIENVSEERTAELSADALINLSPRIRMTMIRLWAQSHHHRMCGTGNLSEITVGYCTKDGDTCSDFNPLGKLTSVEVVEMGRTMSEIPAELVLKTPEDGLSGMADEEKLGVTYEDIHKYIRSLYGICDETWKKIHSMASYNLHKRHAVPMYLPSDEVFGRTPV